MESNNSNTLRAVLASAIGAHVKSMGVTAKDAAAAIGMQYSRLSQIIRGDVKNVSSDAMVNILGSFGYRLTGINGSGNGTEIVLSLDKADGHVLPEIEKPYAPDEETTQKFESGELGQSDEHVRASDASFHVMTNEYGVISGVGQNSVAVLANE